LSPANSAARAISKSIVAARCPPPRPYARASPATCLRVRTRTPPKRRPPCIGDRPLRVNPRRGRIIRTGPLNPNLPPLRTHPHAAEVRHLRTSAASRPRAIGRQQPECRQNQSEASFRHPLGVFSPAKARPRSSDGAPEQEVHVGAA
jgi:hypothetical protein